MVERSSEKGTKATSRLINTENKNNHDEINDEKLSNSRKSSASSNSIKLRKILDDDQLDNSNNKSRKRNRRRRQKASDRIDGEILSKIPNEKLLNNSGTNTTPLEYQVTC